MNCIKEPSGRWGGSWTEKKLDAFSKYVWSYLSIMKKHPNWKTIYFDGFAGSGGRTEDIHKNRPLFEELNISEESNVYKGSAERVLSLKDNFAFNYYYFIDTDKKALKNLQVRIEEKFSESPNIIFRKDDVNNQLLELSTAMKRDKKYAALIFLDPFGMQIRWQSICSLQGTRTDIWILLPTGVIVNRLLDKDGKLEHIEKLTSFFGLAEQEIREFFYKKETEQTLFGEEERIKKVTKPIDKIAKLYVQQLKTIWKFAPEKPLVLLNHKNVPIYHLVFASNNKTAVKIASQIIQREN